MFTCSQHPTIRTPTMGNCPICQAQLIRVSNATSTVHQLSEYVTIAILLGVITLFSLVSSFEAGYFISSYFVAHFMSTLLFILSGAKLLNLKEFAKKYSTYDLIAKKIPEYAYVYPFIELALGIGYILAPTLALLHLLTAIVLGVTSLGIAMQLYTKKTVQCVCFGTQLYVTFTYFILLIHLGIVLTAVLLL